MIIILLFLFIVVNLLIKYFIKDKISKFIANSFNTYWFLSLAISTFEPMGYYEVSGHAYALLIIGVIAFIIGLCIPKFNKKLTTIENSYKIMYVLEKLLLNYKINIILFLLSIYFLMHAKDVIIASAIEGKSMRVTGDSELYVGNNLFKFIYTFIGYPLFNFLMTIIPYALLNFKKKYLIPSILSSTFVFSFIIINAGRVMFVIILLYILIMYVINNKGVFNLSLKTSFISIIFLIVVLLGISSITNFRDYGTFKMDSNSLRDNINDTKERILSYSVLPIVLFDRSIQEDYMSKFNGPLLGKATFAGPELYIGNIIKRVDPDYKTGNDIVISYIQNNYFPISPLLEANFAYTGIFFHYQDFGIIGVIFIPLLFGIFFRKIVLDYYKRPNIALLALIGFNYFMMMYSIFCCYFIKPWITIYIPILLYFGYKYKYEYKPSNIIS
ncbi:MAG: oligosaccharide repeat unit polymerase [Bacteroidaceae bacterium]|nr:oligosaccharide repeat unit polymerase [Bacteroidaceae bacterium]